MLHRFPPETGESGRLALDGTLTSPVHRQAAGAGHHQTQEGADQHDIELEAEPLIPWR